MNDSVKQAMADLPLHPFSPFAIELPTYVANTMSAPVLVSIFAAGCAVIFLVTYGIVQRTRPSMSGGDLAVALWFALCGCIHLFFEGYFSYNAFDMASKTDLFGQLWKEYALSDSRYMSQDAFTVCMETVTAVLWGPMSFATVYLIIADHPLRHPFQLIISLGQLYGDILYYAICTFQEVVFDVVYCRPERFYFWAYYFLCNFFWIVIPFMLIWQSARETARAFAQVKAASEGKKTQ
ncbi:Emopamil-binding protein [Trichoderma longibrachiatum]